MDISKQNERRAKFLIQLYQDSGGSENLPFNEGDIGTKIGLDLNETDKVVEYLIGEDLVDRLTFSEISITHWGIVTAEKIMDRPIGQPENREGMAAQKPTIFISHQSEHKDLAIALKIQLEHAFSKNVDVFVSSDIYDIPGGEQWEEKIRGILPITSVHIVVCAKGTLSRPWINFEAGSAWTRRIPIISACFLSLDKGELPKPYDGFQAFNMDETFPDKLLTSLEIHLGDKCRAQRRQQLFYAALSTEIDKLSKLPARVGVIPEETIQPEIDKKAISLLKMMSDQGRDSILKEELYKLSGMGRLEVDHCLDILVDARLVHRNPSYFSVNHGRVSPFSLSKQGRSFLVSLIEGSH